MIGRVTDAVYLELWESTAKQIESKLGCDRHESRNHLSEAQLAILDRAEDRVTLHRFGQYQADRRCNGGWHQTRKSPPLAPRFTPKTQPGSIQTAGFFVDFSKSKLNQPVQVDCI